MRLYTIVNMYLSDMQKGIQSAHAATEILVANGPKSAAYTWGKNHKTIIVLNGGYSSNIARLAELVEKTDYEAATFNESQEALGGALTGLGIILPEKMYVCMEYARQKLIVNKPTENHSAETPEYTMEPADSVQGAPAEQLEAMVKQLESYGNFSDPEIMLINELMNMRLA